MHLFNFENEEENDCGPNKFESLFCPMQRLTTVCYAEKWKSIPKASEQKVILGRLYSNKETNVIKRLQAHNIVACTFKTTENTTILYLASTTKDNIVILSELTILSSDHLYGKIKYKSENCTREVDFENYLALILSGCEEEVAEEFINH